MPQSVKIFLSWLYFGWLLSYTVIAQSHHFQRFSVEEGLPFIHTYCINQDSLGYLWLGGYGGLSKFDGLQFNNFTQANGLPSNRVTVLEKSIYQTLWVGTTKGLAEIKGDQISELSIENFPKNIKITAIQSFDSTVFVGTDSALYAITLSNNQYTAKKVLTQHSIRCMEVYNQDVLVGTNKGLLSIGVENRVPTVTDTVMDAAINDIHIVEDTLWMACSKGLIKKQGNNTEFFSIFNGLPSNAIRSMVTDLNGMQWIATANGLARYDGKDFKVFFVDQEFNSNDIIQLFKDRESNIWVATYNGIYKLNSQRFLNYTFKDGLLANFIYGIFRDSKNQLWIGSRNKGVFKYQNESFTVYDQYHGLKSNHIGPITEIDSVVYIGTEKGLSLYSLAKNALISSTIAQKIGKKPVNDIFHDSTNLLTYFAHKNTISVVKNNLLSSLSIHLPEQAEIWSLWKDSNQNLWIGTYEGGLFRFNADSTLTNLNQEWNVHIESALDLVATSPTDLWIATFQGVFHYNLTTQKLEQITVSNGLNSPLTYSLLADYNNQLWVGTNQGINRIDLNPKNTTANSLVTGYSLADGFIGVECNTHGAWADKDGSLWFGTVNGLVQYLGDYATHQDVENKTFLTGIKLFYNDTSLITGAQLSHEENRISFSFKGICQSNPKKVRYQYRLKGYDDNWSPPISESTASFSNLNPGDYVFEVKSSNANGTWNRVPTTFQFSIATPYYEEPWFIATLVVLFVSVLAGAYRLRIINVKRKAALERDLDNLKLQALRSQMNPHFIFNSLNSIQFYINNNEKKQANRYLTKFAKLMRLILDNSKAPYIPLKQDIEALNLYVELEQVRFESKFAFDLQLNLDKKMEEAPIPPLMIQPFVENSINHGFSKLNRQGKITVNISSSQPDLLVCVIEDNGIGRKAAQALQQKKQKLHQSAAMGITQGRISALQAKFKDELSIHFEDLYQEHEPFGTRVTITIPIVNEKNTAHEMPNRR